MLWQVACLPAVSWRMYFTLIRDGDLGHETAGRETRTGLAIGSTWQSLVRNDVGRKAKTSLAMEISEESPAFTGPARRLTPRPVQTSMCDRCHHDTARCVCPNGPYLRTCTKNSMRALYSSRCCAVPTKPAFPARPMNDSLVVAYYCWVHLAPRSSRHLKSSHFSL